MEKALRELIKISKKVGSDKFLVLGAFGNTSVKSRDGKFMYIKASGTSLKDMCEFSGWRRLRVQGVRQIVADKGLADSAKEHRHIKVANKVLACCDDNINPTIKPSVETCFHSILGRCVIHLHPVCILKYACSRDGKQEIEKIFQNEKIKPHWVRYAQMGYDLAGKINRIADSGNSPLVLILQNHGIVVSAQQPHQALELLNKVISRCKTNPLSEIKKQHKDSAKEKVGEFALAIRKAIYQAAGTYTSVSHFTDKKLTFAGDKDLKKICTSLPVTPDEFIYLHGSVEFVGEPRVENITRRIKQRMNKGLGLPAAFLVDSVGLFIAENGEKAAFLRDVASNYLLVRQGASQLGGVKTLQKRHLSCLRGDKKAGAILQGQIAIVTGAGSGVGRSIASGLAKAGASVALFDIDKQAAQETSRLISDEFAQAQTLVVKCDVSNEKSVQNAYKKLLAQFGGLDILVNAAGVAPAYSLVTMPVDKWRKAVDINLSGYFLMAKSAATIMIQQGMPASIINISSKSGLQASKNNSAYNATKSAEIHMARGWAMELGQYGIRVNSVCPGNVFEGSGIWNRKYIEVCAKKYGIKPSQVIPYYVNKTILKREVKGRDVADSVVFLCSDKARTITGQILVPDGGQVMVR